MSEFEIIIRGKGNVLPDSKTERGARVLSIEAATEKAINELVSQGAEITCLRTSHNPVSKRGFEDILGAVRSEIFNH